MLDDLIIIRNFLYRFFIIGILLLAVSTISYLIGKEAWSSIYQSLFNLDIKEIEQIVFLIIGVIKAILWFFVLVPALALHWTTNKMKQNER